MDLNGGQVFKAFALVPLGLWKWLRRIIGCHHALWWQDKLLDISSGLSAGSSCNEYTYQQIYLAQLACSFMQAKPFPLGALRFTEHRSHFQVTWLSEQAFPDETSLNSPSSIPENAPHLHGYFLLKYKGNSENSHKGNCITCLWRRKSALKK